MFPKLAITSMSLGYSAAGHKFCDRMAMASKYGYAGIELFYGDLIAMAEALPGGSSPANQIEAAGMIRSICDHYEISIICLQSFQQYEGLIDREKHEELIEKMMLWFQLADALGTDMIHISANFLPAAELSERPSAAIEDLQQIADLGLERTPIIRFSYESLAWSTRSSTWEQSWEIVQKVDRENFGLCLDTFNIAGRVWADPTVPSGRLPNGDAVLRESLKNLAQIDPSKLFFVQIVDAERLSEPLLPGHRFYDEQLPARMSWSRNCRLFYGEKKRGAYLPVEELCRVILRDLKYCGWVSMELFNRKMWDTCSTVPDELARRGAAAWLKLCGDVFSSNSTKSNIVESSHIMRINSPPQVPLLS